MNKSKTIHVQYFIKNDKKIIVLLTLVFLCTSCGTKIGDISTSEKIIVDQGIHSKEDINESMKVLEENFKKKFYKDCTLKKIVYNYDDAKKKEEQEKRNVFDSIYLEYEFVTGSNPDMSLNKNETYHYNMILIKDTFESHWQIKTFGQP